jgi:cell division protein ZapA
VAMSTVENKVIVRIFGEEYPITGSTDPAYISKIAELVDSRMQDVSRRANTQSREKVAILTALSLASELYEKSENLAHVDHSNARLDHLLDELDSALNEPPSPAQ